MSKRQRHLKQRLDELFSTEAEAAAPEPAPATRETATPIEPAAPTEDQARLLAIIDQLPLPAYVKDHEHTWVAVNAAYGELIGHAPADLIGHTDKEQADEAWQLDDRVLDTGQPEEMQETTTLPDGSIRIRRVKRTVLVNDQRAVQYVLGIVQDHLREPHLRADRDLAQFKLGIDRTNAAVTITDGQGTIVYVNPAYEKIYGYSPAEVIGKNPRILKSGQVSPAQYKRFWTRLLSGEPVTGEIINKAKDGHLVPVETNNTPILDENGKITGFLSIQYDITERKKAEAALIERNKQLAALNQLGQVLTRLTKPENVLEQVFNTIGEIFDNRNLYIALYDEHKQEITFPVYTIDGERRQVAGRPLGNGITEYVLHTKVPLLIKRDVQNQAASLGISSIGRASSCYLGVPLLSGDKAVGIIAVQDYEREDVFTAADVELLSTIATQTAAALENTRLHMAELRRALQLQTAAEVSSAASTVLDIDELLPFVVNLIQQRFNLYYVGLFFVNETYQMAVLRAATGEAGRRLLERGHQLPVDDRSMIGWCIGHETARIAVDVGEDAVRFNNPELPETHSELALPLISRGQVLGAMSVQSTELAAFSPQDITVLQTMADQVATAIANAQLLEQSRAASQQAEARLREVQFMQSVGQTVSSSLDLTKVMDLVMNTLEEDMGFTHNALYLVDRQAGTVTTERASGTATQLRGLKRSLEQLRGDILLDILEKGKIDVIDGWDDRFDREIYDSQGHAELVRAFVPLRLRGESIGLLEVGYRRAERARITPDEVRLLGGLADQIAIAVGNARLFDESQQRITELAVVNEISRTLTSTQDVKQLFETIHRQVGRLFDVSNFYIATYDGGDEWSLDYQYERNQLLPSARHKLGRGFTSYILQTKRPLLIRSLAENTSFHAQHDLPTIGESAKSWMGVPLIVAGNVTGVMGIQSYEREGLYDEHNVALFSTIGTQAAAAIQNAQLLQEARLRANELASLNDLSQTLASQLTVTQVLEEVWHGVSRLLDTTNFYIALYDSERREVSFPINASESVLDKEITVMPADQGLTGYIVRTRQPLLIKEDVPGTVTRLGLENVGESSQSYLGVPITLGDQVLGVMAIQSYLKARSYAEHDQELLMAIAGQTAIALQNARLFEETSRRNAELATLNQIMGSASETLDLRTLLNMVLRQTLDDFGFDGGLITMYNEKRGKLERIVRTGLPGQIPEDPAQGLENSLCNYVFESKQPLVIEDFRQGAPIDVRGEIEAGYLSYIGIPLESHGRMLGTWCGFRKVAGVFGQNTFALLQTIGRQVSSTIDNARLFTQTQTTLAETEQLYAASQRLTAATNLQEAVVAMAEGIPLADINRAALWLFERDGNDQVAAAIVSAGWYSGQGVPVMPTGTRLPSEVIRAMPLVLTTEPLFSNDLKTDQRIDPSTATVLQQQRIGAIAILPLWTAGQQIGALLLEAEGPHIFTDAEIRPYISLSQQLATTIYNQQLLEQVKRTALREQTLRELTARVRNSTDPDTIVRTAVRELGNVLGRTTFIRLGDTAQLSIPPAPAETPPPAGNGSGHTSEGGQ